MQHVSEGFLPSQKATRGDVVRSNILFDIRSPLREDVKINRALGLDVFPSSNKGKQR